jgi:hypothetical protein
VITVFRGGPGVLERNPVDVPVQEIGLTTVDRAYINGDLVHSR